MKRFGRIAVIVAIGALSLGMLSGCGVNLDREVSVQGMVLEVPADWLETIESGNNDSYGTISFTEEDEDRDEDETGNSIEVFYYRILGTTSQEESINETEGSDEEVEQSLSSENTRLRQGASLATESAPDVKSTSDMQGASDIQGVSDAQSRTESSQTVQVQANAAKGDFQGISIGDGSFSEMMSINPMPKTASEAMTIKQSKLEREQGVIAWSVDEENTRVVDGAQVTAYEYSFVKEIEKERRKYEYKTVYVVTPAMMYEISIVGDAVSADALIDTIEL